MMRKAPEKHDDAASGGNAREQAPRLLRINSNQLFANRDRMIIEHQGQEYILRITRSGKLILTK